MAIEVVLDDIQDILYSSFALNDNFQKIENGFEEALSRTDDSDNHMEVDLDMSNNDVFNVRNLWFYGDLFQDGTPVTETISSQVGDAQQFAETAEQHKNDAEDAATSASNSADTASQEASEAETWQELSRRWANENEDVEVQNGEFSAYHWAKKAEEAFDSGGNGNGDGNGDGENGTEIDGDPVVYKDLLPILLVGDDSQSIPDDVQQFKDQLDMLLGESPEIIKMTSLTEAIAYAKTMKASGDDIFTTFKGIIYINKDIDEAMYFINGDWSSWALVSDLSNNLDPEEPYGKAVTYTAFAGENVSLTLPAVIAASSAVSPDISLNLNVERDGDVSLNSIIFAGANSTINLGYKTRISLGGGFGGVSEGAVWADDCSQINQVSSALAGTPASFTDGMKIENPDNEGPAFKAVNSSSLYFPRYNVKGSSGIVVLDKFSSFGGGEEQTIKDSVSTTLISAEGGSKCYTKNLVYSDTFSSRLVHSSEGSEVIVANIITDPDTEDNTIISDSFRVENGGKIIAPTADDSTFTFSLTPNQITSSGYIVADAS